jgi:hypothetical protein
MKPIRIPTLSSEQLDALEKLYRTTRQARLRTRAQIDGLAGRRAAPDRRGADRPDRSRKRRDGKALAQALPGRGGLEGLCATRLTRAPRAR